jgi:hypothetical protein
LSHITSYSAIGNSCVALGRDEPSTQVSSRVLGYKTVSNYKAAVFAGDSTAIVAGAVLAYGAVDDCHGAITAIDSPGSIPSYIPVNQTIIDVEVTVAAGDATSPTAYVFRNNAILNGRAATIAINPTPLIYIAAANSKAVNNRRFVLTFM